MKSVRTAAAAVFCVRTVAAVAGPGRAGTRTASSGLAGGGCGRG